MGAGLSQPRDGGDDLVAHRQDNVPACFAQHEGVGEVIDVFRCAGKMEEFTRRIQCGMAGGFFFQEILHGFDVVVGRALNVLDRLRIIFTEIADDRIEKGVCGFIKGGQLRDGRFGGERLQPTHFDLNAQADQPVFTEYTAQCGRLIAIASIDRRDRRQGREVHSGCFQPEENPAL